MKIRLGFVSNSSSEAFICDTDMSVEEVKKYLESLLKLHREAYEDYSDRFNFENVFKEPQKGITFEEFMNLSYYMNYDYMRNGEGTPRTYPEFKDKIFVFSENDNTIPSELFEYIENKLHAERYHLG